MDAVFFYDGPIGRYALQDSEQRLTQMWVGDRIALVPQAVNICETPLLKEAHRQLEAYFSGRLQTFDLPLLLRGTTFQQKVWVVLQTIPYGETITYGELAQMVGNPKASRAVGMANGRNPLPVFVPCHRVVGVGKKLIGYTGGLEIKKKLLSLEGMTWGE